jgi:hypothetical protein
MSAIPLTATELRTSLVVRFVPNPEVHIARETVSHVPGRTGQVFTLVRLSGGLNFSYLARGIEVGVHAARKRPVELEVL